MVGASTRLEARGLGGFVFLVRAMVGTHLEAGGLGSDGEKEVVTTGSPRVRRVVPMATGRKRGRERVERGAPRGGKEG